MGGVEAWWKETTDEETGKWANGSSIVSFFLFFFFVWLQATVHNSFQSQLGLERRK